METKTFVSPKEGSALVLVGTITLLHSTEDFGRTWTNPESAPVKFPEATGQSLKQIWQIAAGSDQEPGKMYCGVEPAALFESNDAGQTWSFVQALFDHPHRPQWQPGGGGLCLHTILVDPSNTKRLHVAISTGGVYRTDDGGKSWQSRNQGLSAEFMPDKYPEFGQCVRKVARNPSRPERLFLQIHGSRSRKVFRTNRPMKPYSGMASIPIRSSRPAFTSAHAAGKCTDRAMRARPGV